MDADAPAGEGDQGEQRGEVAKASGAVADEPHGRVHGLQASVVDAQHDGEAIASQRRSKVIATAMKGSSSEVAAACT